MNLLWVNAMLARALLRADGRRRRWLWRSLFSSRDGRLIAPLRRTLFKKSGMTRPFLRADLAETLKAPALAVWIGRHDTPDATDIARMDASAADWPPVLLRIEVAPDGPPDAAALAAALHAVAGLRLRRALWLPDGMPGPAAAALATQLDASPDPSDALPRRGEVMVVIGAGILPRPHGPRLLVEALAAAALSYGDEVALDADALPVRPWFKPRFSPELAARGVLVGRMAALTAAALDRAARAGLLGGALAPRLDRIALDLPRGAVAHVPHLVAFDAAPPRAPLPAGAPPLPDTLPCVSVIIPTRDGWPLLAPCLASLAATDWPRDRLEVLVVDNGSTEPACLAGLAEAAAAGRIRVLRDARPFNWAGLNNAAARVARGSLLVFLNNDTQALRPDWLRQMACLALQPDIGAVGPKLLYADGTVQHGGVVLGINNGAAHAHLGLAAEAPGYAGLANLTHEVSAVTGACLAIRRGPFEAVGGFDERFAVAFNDVVLCCDLMQHGYRNLYLAEPLFLHLESKTRGPSLTPAKRAREEAEAAAFRARHPALFADDPHYSPNLSRATCYATLVPPSRPPVWRQPARSGPSRPPT